MKRLAKVFAASALLVVFASACGKDEPKETLDAKHLPLPEYVTSAPPVVQETYILAANYPKALAVAPCYCGCGESDGHESNLDCFVDGLGPNGEVTGWDQMGIAWDICVDIAREAVDMYKEGKDLKDIQKQIKKEFGGQGQPTPTPELD